MSRSPTSRSRASRAWTALTAVSVSAPVTPSPTRGGLSMQRALRVLVSDARYSLLSDGAVVKAFNASPGYVSPAPPMPDPKKK